MTERQHKRILRNLLLDTEYQLVFTIALVLSAVVFMLGLGYVVLREADTATNAAIQDVQGQPVLDPAVAEATIVRLEQRRGLLQTILIGAGVCLTAGLFAYGIKMTHRVAGPLHKVGRHCDHVTAGRFEVPRDLRKGDQLVAFYEHFRQAHEVLRQRHAAEVASLRALLAAATEADLAGRTPELAARLADLRTLLASKETGLG